VKAQKMGECHSFLEDGGYSFVDLPYFTWEGGVKENLTTVTKSAGFLNLSLIYIIINISC